MIGESSPRGKVHGISGKVHASDVRNFGRRWRSPSITWITSEAVPAESFVPVLTVESSVNEALSANDDDRDSRADWHAWLAPPTVKSTVRGDCANDDETLHCR